MTKFRDGKQKNLEKKCQNRWDPSTVDQNKEFYGFTQKRKISFHTILKTLGYRYLPKQVMKLGTKNDTIQQRDGPEHLLTVHNKNNTRGRDKDLQAK